MAAMKTSAGILLYRRRGGVVEVLLAHSGGPFYARKDNGAWTIPKGETKDGEDTLAAAKREYQEETGYGLPHGEYLDLGEAKTSSKINKLWAAEGDADEHAFKSNTFELEWPPKSGQMETYPECDRAAWFTIAKAKTKLFKNQVIFIERLEEALGVVTAPPAAEAPSQTSLF